LYKDLSNAGVEVLWDDRDTSAGNKFNDADLMGIPVRLVVSGRLNEKDEVEFKLRKSEETENLKTSEVLGKVTEIIKN
jgi:prolyl-tRNA synthetase